MTSGQLVYVTCDNEGENLDVWSSLVQARIEVTDAKREGITLTIYTKEVDDARM